MGAFLQHIINGLSLGSIYALIALGYTLVFGVLQLINFAHGDVYMIGAFVGYFFAHAMGYAHDPSLMHLILTILAAMVGAGSLGYLVERVAYRPLRKAPRINLLITAVGVSMLLEFSGQIFFGSAPRFFPEIYKNDGMWQINLDFIGQTNQQILRINPIQVIVFVIATTLTIALQALVFRTRTGRALRAVSFNHELAGLMGIPVQRMISATFVLGSSLAGAAGVLVGLVYPKIDPMMGVLPGLKCFVAAVLGGIGNIKGAVIGAILIGLSEEFLVGYGYPTLKDALAFTLLIVMLIFRPQGLFPVQKAEKV